MLFALRFVCRARAPRAFSSQALPITTVRVSNEGADQRISPPTHSPQCILSSLFSNRQLTFVTRMRQEPVIKVKVALFQCRRLGPTLFRHQRGQLTTFKTVPHDTRDTPSVHSTVVQLSPALPSNRPLPSGALLCLRVPPKSLHMFAARCSFHFAFGCFRSLLTQRQG